MSYDFLPDEIQRFVLAFAPVRPLARSASVSMQWRKAAGGEARRRLKERGVPAEDAEDDAAPRTLRALELLEDKVGRRPRRAWQDEWVGLQMAKRLRLLGSLCVAASFPSRVERSRF